ncbi:hypothetical protein [Guptibacillus spartinae]|uniref:hypothetical protein n=1 Tax=Guptibacillus spartinae TaxID=3025679 RepID=UPI00235E1E4B|nr:hypothetical protein [Pseudalkalibacillus spartinae]
MSQERNVTQSIEKSIHDIKEMRKKFEVMERLLKGLKFALIFVVPVSILNLVVSLDEGGYRLLQSIILLIITGLSLKKYFTLTDKNNKNLQKNTMILKRLSSARKARSSL